MALLFRGARPYLEFGRSHYEEHFCKIVLNLDQWFSKCRLKIFLIYTSGGPYVVEDIMRNISVKLFLIWFRWTYQLKIFLIYNSGGHLCNFGRGIIGTFLYNV